ncbi:hemolysin family protein [Bacillus sp. FJAT-29953]|nr:hemolysin family protein [Bacillus sp. FJAT-29953]
MMIFKLLLIVVLILLTGFFVAVEFAIVKVRPSRLAELVLAGKKGAVPAKQVVTKLDEYLSACQFGITVTALGLGWLGEPTFEKLLHPLFSVLHLNESVSHFLAFVLAFVLVTFLHVVVGELAPKTVAIQKAEAIALLFSRPMILFNKIMHPFIWVLNSSARALAGLFGFKPATEQELAHSEEELRLLLAESLEQGEINQNEFQYVSNIFEFDERTAKEIMVPRLEMNCISVDESVQEVLRKLKEEGYTRYPVMEGDKDHIIGVMNVKRFLTAKLMNKGLYENWKIKSYIQPVITVIETIPIHDLLVRMQMERIHMAILHDEYGGTSGLVTVEDIIEEIVGEVRDEFDADEVADIRQVAENHYILDAKVPIASVNQLLDTSLAAENVNTIGGWFLTQHNAPQLGAGATLETQGWLFKINEANGSHIMYLEVQK